MERSVDITGMTCAACESTVTDIIASLDGVEHVSVSVARQRAQLTGPSLPSDSQIRRALADTPYGVGREPVLSRDPVVWRDVILAAIAIGAVALVFAFAWTGPTLGSLTSLVTSGSLVLILILGIGASVSTCAAVVGAVAAGLGATVSHQAPRRERWTVQLAFNGGRVAGFALFGAVIGGLGTVLALSGPVITAATLLSAVVIALVGLRLTGLSPRVSGWRVTLPARWGAWASAPVTGRAGAGRAALVGAATFVLPCGFTQAVQIYAISTASPLRAGVILAVFALGTTPGLLAIGMASAIRAQGWGVRAVGVLAVGFGAVIFTSVASTWGPAPSSTFATEATSNVSFVEGVQHVSTDINQSGYSPHKTVVYVNEPVTWTFTTSQLSCAAIMDLESLGLGRVDALFESQTVEFTPTSTGVFDFACYMDMYQGQLEVIERPLTASAAAAT